MEKKTLQKIYTSDLPVTALKGVSTARASQLSSLGVFTCGDLLHMYPRAVEDRTCVKRIFDIVPGEKVTVRARLLTFSSNRYRAGLTVQKLRVSDGSGFLDITLFNKNYLIKQLRAGEEFYFFGETEKIYQYAEMKNPVMTPAAAAENFTGILPVYRLTAGLSQNILRKTVMECISGTPHSDDFLPRYIIDKYGLCSEDYAIRTIHFPGSMQAYETARKRLAFDELLMLQIMIRSLKNKISSSDNIGISFPSEKLTDKMISALPFKLSDSQIRVWDEIKNDMEKSSVMNRLVLGDVGSGKTVIAELAMLKAIASGYQAVFMAPTEILASQHMKNISGIFEPLGIRTVLLTGSLSASEKRSALEAVSSGLAQCIVGTHALIQKNVSYKNVGIVITDEQHRFGVHQREILAKSGKNPDVLIMSATPIPRTLALSLYGDMDVSYIDTMPLGRLPVKTYRADSSLRSRVYTWAAKLAKEGSQVYIVHPLISEDSDETGEEAPSGSRTGDVLSAEDNFAECSKTFFKGLTAALVHGKMPSKEKDNVMNDFSSGKISVLFSTTVIEVGVDVANASLIIIENAERFGLAQLHQLRGRVGRNSVQSYCVLFSDASSELVNERLNVMCAENSGFKIAEKDLELRGPGDFFGTAQHGLPALRIANLYEDTDLLISARDCADEIIKNIPETADYFIRLSEKINAVY